VTSSTILLMVRDLKKWVRSPAWMIASLIQPVLWLALFGNAFNPANLIPASPVGAGGGVLQSMFMGAPNYITYLSAGMLCFLGVSWAVWAGGPLVTDRTGGYLNKLLATPIKRSAITLSLLLSSVLKGLFLAALLLVIAVLIPGGLMFGDGFGPLELLGVFAATTLLTIGFLWLFLMIAVRARKFETLAALGSTLLVPIMFMSSTLFPTVSMPDWLRTIAELNPVSKAADAARYLIIQGHLGPTAQSIVVGDMIYLLGFALVCTVLGVVVSNRGLRIE